MSSIYVLAALALWAVPVQGRIVNSTHFVSYSPLFDELFQDNPELVLVATQPLAVGEGPVYDKFTDKFMWTDGNRPTPFDYSNVLAVPAFSGYLMNYKPEVVRAHSHHANGQTVDLDDNVLTCEGTSRIISKAPLTNFSAREPYITHFEGKPFNSPNDVVVKSDRTVWFTDPEYGCEPDQFPSPNCPSLPNRVYRFDPRTNNTTAVTGDFDLDRPNGLAFSLDETKLFLVDSGAVHDFKAEGVNLSRPHEIVVYDVAQDGATLKNRRLWTVVESDPKGIPDGIRFDERGNMWIAAGDGVQVYSPDAKLLGKVMTHMQASNLVFGGRLNNVLFVAAGPYAYKLELKVAGASRPKASPTPTPIVL